MSIELDYFYGNEAEQYAFYRVPKLLITSPDFNKAFSERITEQPLPTSSVKTKDRVQKT